MSDRADPLGRVDVSGFKPRKPAAAAASPEAIRRVAEEAAFPSREPAGAGQGAGPADMRAARRTGRNVQFQCKVTQDVENDIYALTAELQKRMDAQMPGARFTVGMTVERMVAALKRELGQS
jgi:hypothetical protein